MTKKKIKKKSSKILKRIFKMDPERGAAALVVGMEEPGYKLSKLERNGKNCVVTFIRNN